MGEYAGGHGAFSACRISWLGSFSLPRIWEVPPPKEALTGTSTAAAPTLPVPREQASMSHGDGLPRTRAGPRSQGCILSTTSHSNMMPSLST